MPRKNPPAIKSENSQSQAIVRSERARLERSNRNFHKPHRKTTKARGSYLPEPKILRIQLRYVAGENKSEIARNENCDRGTVARIVQFPEVQQFIAQMQQEFFGLVPDAMAAVRYSLQVEKNAKVGYRVLEGTGVAPRQGERMQVPTTEEDSAVRQMRLMAAAIAERHRIFDIELPDDLKKAFDMGALDEGESAGYARAAETNLSRR